MNEQIDIFMVVRGYLTAALWSSTDNSNEQGGDPLDDNYDIEDIHPTSREQALNDCQDFVGQCAEAGIELLELMDEFRLGVDLWLSRNRHGAGFWDRGYGRVGNRLADIAQQMGSKDAIVGDDGHIYFE